MNVSWDRWSVFEDLANQLVCVGHGPSTDTVLVNSRIVLRNTRSTLADEAAIFAETHASVQRMRERLGLKPAEALAIRPWMEI